MAKCRIDWAAVEAFRKRGHTVEECASRFGFHVDAWYKAMSRGAVEPPAPVLPVFHYDWAAVRKYYEQGHSYRECREKFGFAAVSWAGAVRRGDVVPRPKRMPLDRILAVGRCRKSIKQRLLLANVLENRCSECGLSEWNGRPLAIQLDHINGVSNDHRVENLRMLCPNCHSQTETFGGRNNARKANASPSR